MVRRQSNTEDTEAFIRNEEGLYDMAKRALRRYGNRRTAAKMMFEELRSLDESLLIPDGSGAKFTVTGIYNAMDGL